MAPSLGKRNYSDNAGPHIRIHVYGIRVDRFQLLVAGDSDHQLPMGNCPGCHNTWRAHGAQGYRTTDRLRVRQVVSAANSSDDAVRAAIRAAVEHIALNRKAARLVQELTSVHDLLWPDGGADRVPTQRHDVVQAVGWLLSQRASLLTELHLCEATRGGGVADMRRRFRVVLNRYPGAVIGVCAQFGARVFSLTWGAPGRVIKEPS